MSSTTSAHPNPSTISLPPISSIDPHRQRTSPSPAELHYEYLQQQHSASRQLPVPVSYEYANMTPNMLRHDGMPGRPIYPGGPAYQMSPGRMPLPPATDPNLMIAGRAHQKKEVKRRTKTGCLTCRKRRIKCDEARPDCRNCLKSKRECSGYGDTPGTFQSASTSPRPQLQSASTSHQLLAPVPSTSSSIHQQALLPLTSPSLSSKAPSVKTESSLDPGDYPTPKHESALPPLQYHRSKIMDSVQESRGSLQPERPYQYTAIRRAIPRSIDDLCTIDGNRRPNLPPLPSDTPNLDAIQKIYDAAFAPGLDRLLETRWYSKAGFSFLVSDHDLLAQFLAYITMIHSNQNNPSAGPSAALASQEARITWALMSLCSKAELSLAETRILTRRYNALESLITAQLVANPSLLVEDVEEDIGPESGSVLQKQIAQRSRDFWSSLTHFVSLLQASSSAVENTSQTTGLEVELSKCRARLDNFENRDVIFSIMQLHFLSSGHSAASYETPASQQQRSGPPHGSGAVPTRHQEWFFAKDFLDKEAGGQSTTQVLSTVCGIALRAWDEVL